MLRLIITTITMPMLVKEICRIRLLTHIHTPRCGLDTAGCLIIRIYIQSSENRTGQTGSITHSHVVSECAYLWTLYVPCQGISRQTRFVSYSLMVWPSVSPRIYWLCNCKVTRKLIHSLINEVEHRLYHNWLIDHNQYPTIHTYDQMLLTQLTSQHSNTVLSKYHHILVE